MTRAFHYDSFIEFSEVSFLLSVKIHRTIDMLSDFNDQQHSKYIDLHQYVIRFDNDFIYVYVSIKSLNTNKFSIL